MAPEHLLVIIVCKKPKKQPLTRLANDKPAHILGPQVALEEVTEEKTVEIHSLQSPNQVVVVSYPHHPSCSRS